ncbi:MAG TPA: ribosome small subunit-dependent GTPase A [Actinomycetota bacterium]|nr:ribosome small subunit-dependent GTPase A [Actinomycetota bacterium]
MTNLSFSLRSLGWNDYWTAVMAEVTAPGAEPARVIRRDRGWIRVATDSDVRSIEIAGQTGELVTGDWVVVEADRLLATLPRKGVLRRSGRGGVEQLLAANVDIVLLVCGLDRPVTPGRVHRGAVQAWDAGASAVVVLNKADLFDNSAGIAQAIAGETPGLEVLTLSSRTGEGLDAVRAHIRGRTAVLLGESGAGKSSLLNALAGRELSEEGAVRESDSKGKHTTVRRELFVLPEDAVVIDTPGIRAFGLAASTESVEAAFEDIEELAEHCRFGDCGHVTEPGCAVKEAIEQGTLRPERLQTYLGLRRELASQVVRVNPHARRRQERKFARLTREGQDAKRGLLDE